MMTIVKLDLLTISCYFACFIYYEKWVHWRRGGGNSTQVQPVTCCDFSVFFLYWRYSIDSSKLEENLPVASNFNQLFS